MSRSGSETLDVAVIGGGPSGVAAAVAAAREGSRVALAERYGFLGGSLTAALVAPMMGFHSGSHRVVAGIAQEIVDEMVARGASPGHVPDPIDFCHTVTPFDHEGLKQVLMETACAAGVRLLLHSQLLGARSERGTIRAATLAQKGGPVEIHARVFVDATGDGDLSAAAGAPWESGRPRDGLAQPMTLMLRLGGVRWDEVMDHLQAHPEQIQHGHGVHGKIDVAWLRALPCRGFSGFSDAVAEARERGEWAVPRDRVLVFEGVRPGEATVNATRVLGRSGVSGADLALAEVEGRAQARQVVEFLRGRIPGFGGAHLLETPAQIGVRESRRVRGDYTLTADDVLGARKFEDAVARGAYPIDIHDPASGGLATRRLPAGEHYTIPYRCLLPQGGRNWLVAGRCISATHEAAASARISPVAMALGQAAGTAAALAARSGITPREVDVAELRRTLAERGAVV